LQGAIASLRAQQADTEKGSGQKVEALQVGHSALY